MPELNKQKILVGRKAVDAYRTAHTKLYEKGWHKGIPEEHTLLLEKMLAEFKKHDFNSLDEFFDASELLNIREFGFADREDFEANATEVDEESLERMWQ